MMGKFKRNPGTRLDLDYVDRIQINRSAVERRAKTLPSRRAVKKQWQAAWLLKALSCIDLTTLSGDDTPQRVRRLCAKALNPVAQDILAGLGMDGRALRTGAVCVYHNMIGPARHALEDLGGASLPVAVVSTGFPAAQISMDVKLMEIEKSVAAGASEIDIVISREPALMGDWKAVYDEVKAFRKACGRAHMKTILATGELKTLRNVARASAVCMMAGADFIKTSTGKEPINATLPVSLVMVRMIRDYHQRTGHYIGFKPAGGISTAKDALSYLFLIREELGRRWLEPDLLRIGASSLLGDIERQLSHSVSGCYAAGYRLAMG